MISYGGLPLLSPSRSLTEAVESALDLRDIWEWIRPNIPAPGVPGRQSVNAFLDTPLRIGELIWPTGATRWAYAHLLASGNQLRQIRRLAYRGNVWTALPLVMDDGAGGRITTNLFLLPARPLFDVPGIPKTEESLFLVTLVDARWRWYEKAGTITVTDGTTTWAQILASVGTLLGETITPDAISSAYLKPNASLSGTYDSLPPLLDVVCASVGHRLVRKLDGTVVTQTATTALASQDAQLLAFDKHSGGQFRFDRRLGDQDFLSLAPATFTAVFGDESTTPVSLSSLALPRYPSSFAGHTGTAWVRTDGLLSAGEKTAYANQAATDFWNWITARQGVEYCGIQNYTAEGASDRIIWRHEVDEATLSEKCGTRVERGPWHVSGPNGAGSDDPYPGYGTNYYVTTGNTYIFVTKNSGAPTWNGFLLYQIVFSSGDNTVWQWNGSTWVQIGGCACGCAKPYANVSWGSTTVNDYALASGVCVLRANVTGSAILTSISTASLTIPAGDVYRLTVVNVGSVSLTLQHDSGGTAAYRLVNSSGADFSLAPGSFVELIYDPDNSVGAVTLQRWRVEVDDDAGTSPTLTENDKQLDTFVTVSSSTFATIDSSGVGGSVSMSFTLAAGDWLIDWHADVDVTATAGASGMYLKCRLWDGSAVIGVEQRGGSAHDTGADPWQSHLGASNKYSIASGTKTVSLQVSRSSGLAFGPTNRVLQASLRAFKYS